MERRVAGELILIVEDNDKNRKLVREVLQLKGYHTLEATTAEEGFEIARAHKLALILMDIQLPGIDGVTALSRLKADPATRTIPVMAITASAMLHDLERIRQAGFDAYQTKPISVKEFVATVQKVLDKNENAS
jgi:two-component system cell cycle response regulator DivK